MSIKPVAWINADNTMTGIPSVLTEYGPNRRPLYALPDTHRVVPVTLLEHLRSLMVIYQIDHTEEQIRAIIEDKENT
jgi:hypothetical protein